MEKSSHSTPPSTTTTAGTTATADVSSPHFLTATGGGATVPTASSTSSTNTSGSTASSSAMQNPIRMLNKASHKISKPAAKPHHLPRSQSCLSATTNQDAAEPPQAAQPAPHPTAAAPLPPNNLAPPQPPVYNINKNDFRDVVQKLTGSTTHLNPRPPSAPVAPAPPVKPAPAPVIPPASATSSRLQRIRPPPLAQLGPRPPPLVQHPIPAPGVTVGASTLGGGCVGPESGGGYAWARPWMSTPLSPLPPFPTVSAAAESPISAYMRRLQGGNGGGPNALLPLSPGPMGAPLFPLPSSPLGMGCLPSPRSAFQTTLPQSPRVPLPNPKMKDH